MENSERYFSIKFDIEKRKQELKLEFDNRKTEITNLDKIIDKKGINFDSTKSSD